MHGCAGTDDEADEMGDRGLRLMLTKATMMHSNVCVT
jgi:hypothetical protein